LPVPAALTTLYVPQSYSDGEVQKMDCEIGFWWANSFAVQINNSHKMGISSLPTAWGCYTHILPWQTMMPNHFAHSCNKIVDGSQSFE
jgi:hypothetical protein